MSDRLRAPDNFAVEGKDGAALSTWDTVEGADGYKLQFFTADEPERCIKSRYAQDTKKMILGFENGREYLVRVCAFKYNGNLEERGNFTGKIPFTPVCVTLKAQGTVCLKAGETEQLICEQNGETPNVRYETENPEIAEVNSDGVITAKAKGECCINITADDGQTFRTKVVVERALSDAFGKARLMLLGDIMCAVYHQRAVSKLNYDFNDAFLPIKETLSKADYAVGVLETTCYDAKPFEYEQLRLQGGPPNCNSPSTFISACANAGINGLVTANNHNCDTGKAGLEATVDEIRRCGLDNIGTMGDNPVVVKVNGIKVGIIACCMISNGLESSFGDDMFSVINIIGKYDEDYFLELVNRARALGAEYVIAYQHWGKMNSLKLLKAQTETAKFMANSGVDLIVGSHPHVIQRFSYIKTDNGSRVPCAYSLGNFLTSMGEMRENRDSVILNVELTREETGSINAKLSYIPCICEKTESGAVVCPALPPHSEECRESFMRTKQALGKLINHFRYRPTVMFSGSAILSDIFGAGSGFRTDKTAMYLSQMSLGSEKSFDPPADCADETLKLEFTKDIAGYIKNTAPEYLAVDFYTAASVSCHRTDNVKTEEPCYFTNIRRFRNTDFFEKHSYELVRVHPPFGDDVWRPLIKRYAQAIKSAMPRGRVVLFRTSVSEKKFIGSELRVAPAPERRNRLIRAMEDLFIQIVDPVVIDLAKYYFTTTESKTPQFEKAYYANAYRAFEEVAAQNGRRYIYKPDLDIWYDRVLNFYDNMTARSYQSWLLDMKCAADKLIARTNKEFAAKHRGRILRIKQAGECDLLALRDFFKNDYGAEEVVRAAEIIATLERGNLSKPYEFFEPAFKNHYNIIKTMVRLLAAESNIAVNEMNAEIVFLLRGKPQFKRYVASLNRMTIDIWGSCVSRESINHCKDAFVGKYIFKQAPILAYEDPIDIDFPDGAEEFCGSYWRRRTMHDAFERNGFDVLDESNSQWIMIDFYDLICSMADYKGGLFEVDDFIRRTEFYKKIKNDCVDCYLFEKRDMKYCFDMITRFAHEMYEIYENRIILIKTDPKNSYITLDNRLVVLEDDGMFEIKRKFISLCEERFASVTGCYVIDISKHFFSSDSFPLGGAHIVHYESEFYRQAAQYISEILNGSEKKLFSTVDDNYLLLRGLKLNRNK